MHSETSVMGEVWYYLVTARWGGTVASPFSLHWHLGEGGAPHYRRGCGSSGSHWASADTTSSGSGKDTSLLLPHGLP